MGKEQKIITIGVDVQATLSGMNDVVNKLNQGLREGATKVDLTKGIGSSLSKHIEKYKQEMGKFSELTKDNQVNFADSKEAIKSGENLIKTFREIKRIVGDFDNLTIIDAKRIFPEAFDSRVQELYDGLSKLGNALNTLETKRVDLSSAEVKIAALRKEAGELEVIIGRENEIKIKSDEAKGVLQAVNEEIDRIRAEAEEGISLKIKVAKDEKQKAIEAKEKIWDGLKDKGLNEEDFQGSRRNATVFKGKTATDWSKQATSKSSTEAQKAEAQAALKLINIYKQQKDELMELEDAISAYAKQADALLESLSKIGSIKLPEAVRIGGGSEEEIKEATMAVQWQQQAFEEAEQAATEYGEAIKEAKNALKKQGQVTNSITEQEQKIKALKLEIGELENAVDADKLKQAFANIGIKDLDIELLQSKEGIEQLQQRLLKLDEYKLTKLKGSINEMGLSTAFVDDAIDTLRKGLGQVDEDSKNISKVAKDIENLKNQAFDFFSITNSVQLFKRAVSSAMDTIKELDATMTEAAVVTDFSVGDMWNKLPQYASEAQKLGVSINGLYGATTLYYQQGLKTNEAMALGVETMKMARIAGMDSENATKAMTAALRGFNMEINEISAVQVNDVYSKLAAITAADTSQIATAMEKTASIAASANMEFETTAALLAQIIETTQEAPETAGTAMKTIIARFSEVKTLASSGQKTGKDAEGEEIDVNKIQTALRSVGISMSDFFNGTEGLDSVLLKLAEKWDTLDFTTQRYIATTAAGSRQQSRFIAMMSDYARTTQLVSEAQDSAGASQKQFEKTQDSMEAKLQKLQNAWDQFLMGLSNNEVLKGAVDVLTTFIEGINKVIDGISGGNGLVKSISSLITVIGALLLGGKAIEGVTGWLSNKLNPGASTSKEPVSKGQEATDEVAKTVVPEPKQDGTQKGQQHATGFIDGFIAKIRSGASSIKNAIDEIFVKKETVYGPMRDEDKTRYKSKSGKKVARKSQLVKAKKDKTAFRFNASKLKKSPAPATKKADQKNEGAGKDHQQQVEAQVQANAKLVQSNQQVAASQAQASNATQAAASASQENAQVQEKAGPKIKITADNLMKVGGAALGAGVAVGLLSNYFSDLGMDEAAKWVGYASTALTGLGTAITAIIPIWNALGAHATKAGIEISIAGWSGQLAWWWIPVIVAAVAGLVVLAVALGKAFEAASDKAQLEKLNKELDELNSNVDDAKNKLEEMKSAREELDKMNDVFENLTKGSREWKEALIENNQKVLDLIGLYPQLAGAVEKGLNGELVITNEGWDAMLAQQQTNYTNAFVAKTAKQQEIENKQLYIQTEKTIGDTFGKDLAGSKDFQDFFATKEGQNLAGLGLGSVGLGLGSSLTMMFNPLVGMALAAVASYKGGEALAGTADSERIERQQTGGFSYEEFDKFLAIAAEKGVTTTDGGLEDDHSELQQLFKDMGGKEEDWSTFYTNLNRLGTEFDELALAAWRAREAEIARAEAVASSVAQSSSEVQASEWGSVAEEVAAQAFIGYDNQVKEQADSYLDLIQNRNNLFADKAKAEELLEKYAQQNNMDLKQLQAKIDSGDISEMAIANSLAAEEVTKNMEKSMVKVTKEMSKLAANAKDPTTAKNIASLMTDRGLGLTKGALDEFDDGKDLGTYLAEQFGLDDDNKKDEFAIGLGFENYAAFIEDMKLNRQAGSEAFDKINTQLENIGDIELPANLGAEAAQAITNKLSMINATQGSDSARDVATAYNDIVKGMDFEEAQAFTKYLADIKWNNLDDIEQFKEYAEGLNIDNAALERFVGLIGDVGNATRQLEAPEVFENAKTVNKIVYDIQSGKQGRVFSKEQYEAMTYANPSLIDNFVQDMEGNFILVDSTMNDLVNALQDNTKALVGQEGTKFEAKAKIAEGFDGYDWEQAKSSVGSGNRFTGSNYLREFNDRIEALSEEDLKALNIEGLTSKESFMNLSNEDKVKVMEQIQAIAEGGSANYYREEAKKYQTDYDKQSNFVNKTVDELLDSTLFSGAAGGGSQGAAGEQAGVEKKPMPSLGTRVSFHGTGGRMVLGSAASASGGKEGATTDEEEPTLQLQEIWDDETRRAILAQAGSMGVSEQQIEAYQNLRKEALALQKEGDFTGAAQLEKEAQNLLVNSIYRKKYNTLLEKTGDKMKGLAEEYAGVDENDPRFQEAVNQYSDLFSGTLNEDFIKKHFQEIQDAAANGGEAMDELYDKMNREYGLTVTADGNFDGLNGLLGKSKEDMEKYLTVLEQLGMVEVVRYKVETAGAYPTKGPDGSVVLKNYEAGSEIDLIRPRNGADFETVLGGKGSSKSGGGSAPKKWENPYDEFYNSIEKINESLRMREKLEQRYQRLVNRNAANAAELANIQRDQLSLLEAERKEREYILRGRERQMSDIINEYSDVGNYAQWNEEKMRIEIDWNSLEQLDGSTDEELTGRVEEFISKLEEQQKLIEEEIDSIESIEDATWEIYSSGKDEYLDLESQIKEALVNSRQREIDELSEINNSINDANSAILDSMQKQIDQERQLRDNQKTEEEIANKENRLAYLRQDTSGANALEIMKLEKEINDQKQDHTDTLIDQKISDLQEQNDLAAEQREQQIEIMQSQLDWYEKSQQVWNDVHTLMQTGLDLENNLIKGSDLETILKGENGFESMSQIEQMNWLNELESLVANGLKWLSNGAMQSLYGVGAEVSFVNADGQLITGKINSSGDVEAEGQIYSGKNFFMSTSGDLTTTQTRKEASEAYKETVTEPTPEPPAEPEEPSKTGWYFSKTGKRYWSRADAEKAVNSWFNEEKVKLELMAAKNKTAVSLAEVGALEQTRDRALASIRIHQFKTGGLADFTGPAWLDGTKSRPEYILNADQTKAFFSLVDVLSSLQSGSSKTTQNSGDNTYDIDINVESIGSDYDVERLADTVKRLINEDARYRNNNAINLMR